MTLTSVLPARATWFPSALALLATLGLTTTALADDHEPPAEPSAEAAEAADSKASFSLAVTTDTFFGFAPMATAGWQFTDVVAFTAYGIYWSGGSGAAWGNWGEFGVGVNFTPIDGIDINPQVGVVNGNLLSKGAADGQFGGVFADGLVPNLTVNFDLYGFESEIYAGYYMPLRSFEDPANPGTNLGQTAYIHYWANAGYQPVGFFSFGAHWEHLWGGATGAGADVYQWIGPYIQFSDPKGKAWFRFAGGPDLAAGDSFYKMTMGMNF